MIEQWRIIEADCHDALGMLPDRCIDAVVTDPPYGLEFMGKDWDRFRSDDPGTDRHRGKNAGSLGLVGQGDGSHPARREHSTVTYGGNKRPSTFRCTTCGRRDQHRNPHQCAASARWAKELIDPYVAPPGMIAFQNWGRGWALELLRVLKPGGYVLAFGGSRTSHRLVCAFEEAGFEIRDSIVWLYGSGFPKSLNIADRAWHELGPWPNLDPERYARAARLARERGGYGTGLKPAHEPIMVARRPLEGTVVANLERYGTGAINVDGCRVPLSDGDPVIAATFQQASRDMTPDDGRWPPNVVLSHAPECNDRDGLCAPWCPVRQLDKQAGNRDGGRPVPAVTPSAPLGGPVFGQGMRRQAFAGYADIGGASRFFPAFRYQAKAGRAERERGCEQLPARTGAQAIERAEGSAGARSPRAGAGRAALNSTEQVCYPRAEWVLEVLGRKLPAGTVRSLRKATAEFTTRCNDGSAWSMCWCGSPSTDPFHPAIRSIIETESGWTTGSKISPSSPRAHTSGCTAAAFGVMASGGSLAGYVEFRSPWMRATGTSHGKVGRSTDAAVHATSVESWLRSERDAGKEARVKVRNFHPT